MTDDPDPSRELLDPSDLIGLAAAGWRLGQERCAECGGYHRVWGTLRAAGVVGGTAADEAILAPLLSGMLKPDGRVFLAGSADSGLLDLVVRAAGQIPLKVEVADLCATPLAVIEQVRRPTAIDVSTRRLDLADLEDEGQRDLILSHSMLPFVPQTQRLEILVRLRRALAPDGRLVLAARTSAGLTATEAELHDQAWTIRARKRITDAGVPLPGPAEAFDADLATFAARRQGQLGGFETAEVIAGLLEQAGFEVLQTLKSQETTRLHLGGGTHSRQSYVFVARDPSFA